MKLCFSTAALGLALLSSRAKAAEVPVCTQAITRTNVIACALEASLALRVEQASRRAGDGRREAASALLPSNPVLSGTFASRTGVTERSLNWSASLAQEIEIAGQRGLRLEQVGAELRSLEHRSESVKAAVAEESWVAYFKSIAATERLVLASRLEAAAGLVSETVRGMVATGLASDIDLDLADAVSVRAIRERIQASEDVTVAQIRVAALMGRSDPVETRGELLPLRVSTQNLSPAARPELLSLRETHAALEQRVDVLRRTRVSNPTVSVFAQNDGFNERVFGAGLSFPIPLPQPVGRSLTGEITEARGLSDRAAADAERLARLLQAELAVAKVEYDSKFTSRQVFTRQRVERATTRLENITTQVAAARVPVREALIAQQALVEQLKAEIESREALCVASVRLSRVAGLPLEGDSL